MILTFLKNLWNNNKKDIIGLVIIIVLGLWAIGSMRSCSQMKTERNDARNNIVALCDSIEYWQNKNGELIAEKTILVGEIDDLKYVNSEMYNDLAAMKQKNAELAAKIEGYIENPKVDTLWQYSKDTLYINANIVQPFEFKNDFRLLSGNITLSQNTMGLNITNDIVYFDYTLALDDGILSIKSDNPYVRYNSISGIQLPKEKPKRWNIGVQAGLGFNFDLVSQRVGLGPYLGLGVSYGFGF